MKRFHLAILFLSLLGLVLGACGGSTPSSTTKTAEESQPVSISLLSFCHC